MGKKNKRSQDDVPELEPEPELATTIDGDCKKKVKKKKKRSHDDTETEPEQKMSLDGDAKKEKKKKKKKKKNQEEEPELVSEQSKTQEEEKGNVEEGRATVSIAIAGSIIHNTQSLELATRLAGQIARAATIFRIDEIVVFDNKSSSEIEAAATNPSDSNESGASFLVRILKYLETPQYLRKSLFPKQNDLRYVGMLPPLDAPHHLRKHEWEQYREGVTLSEKAPNSENTMVDVGLSKSVVVDQVLSPGIRVTVAMGTNPDLDLVRKIVPPSKPREEAGMYWGYKVRYASQLSSVFKECPFQGGYDYLIGTSEHGVVISSSELKIPTFRHLLIAFGGLAGLEESIEDDNQYKGKNVREVFNIYLNTCPHQGSRTIRAEEAMFISLQYFQEPINRAVKRL
ncbi:PREDICTED: putative methyltransferase C9orf114 [Camelina sativa]|uniref:Methyltransferase C9orf114 n=1 Tax=Camelina sativa TaxID=90675 RepID=A0ABM0T4E7_CAMSA|nr:PREDICTED: putative methyltransferase C9orf114 [Camelina sativa]